MSASQPIPSVWITANAGSGKTTALTERVVGLLLRGVAPERICCITYTKAAASEMRARVLQLLRRLLLTDEDGRQALMTRILGHAPDAEQTALARLLFGRVLDSPGGGLQLTTIHGFCQNILRRFPIEAGVAPHFTVLEDSAAETMLRTAKHRLMGEADSPDALLVEALALLGERSGEYRFDAIMNDIIARRTSWDALWRGQTPELLRNRLFAAHGVEGLDAAQLQDNFVNCVMPHEAAAIRDHLPLLASHRNQGEREMARVLALWLQTPPEARHVHIDAFCLLFLTKEGTRRARMLNAKEFPDGSPLRDACERLAEKAFTYQAQRAALACAEESFAIAVLARQLMQFYERGKAEAHALDYDDLIGHTRALFSNGATLGWVMSKLDHRIDHLLIDEAQDTSAEQWHIAHLLVEELIASNDGIGSGNQPRSLLVVGDEKQSIYSFQGAAPELFAKKRGEFEAMLEGSASPLEPKVLDTSYRSAEAVLKLVDEVAKQPAIAAALSAEGVIHEHLLHRREQAGLVALYPAIATPERVKQAPFTIAQEYQLTSNAAQLLADEVAASIDGWLQSGRMLENEGRPLHAGDILILVHKRKPIVLPLIRALQRRGVPVAGLDRLTLSEHLAVKDLLALMQWCLNPADDLALAQVLRSPIVGLSDEELRALAYGRPGRLWPHVNSHALARWLGMNHLAPYEFLTDVLEAQGARRKFAERFGEEVHEVLDELKAQAAALPQSVMPTLAHFHDWLAGNSRQIKREQESGAGQHVRIMTVHGAKGLEAPVVLLVDTVSVPTTQREIVYFHRTAHGQLLPVTALSPEAKKAPLLEAEKDRKAQALVNEYQRLLYVALTRARDELHLFGIAGANGQMKENSWYETAAASLTTLGATEEEGVRIFRDLRPAQSAKQAITTEKAPPAMPDWARAPVSRKAEAPTLAAPSRLVELEVSPYAQKNAIRGAKERGVRIHRVLELLNATSDAAQIAQLVRYLSPDWSGEQQAQVTTEIAALHEKERWLWANPSQPEASLCGQVLMDGVAVPINGQMDLLVETPDAMVIVDYKTGNHVPGIGAEVSVNYLIQLKTYQSVVAQLYPHKPVRVAILWTAKAQLMWLDAEVAATAWPKQNVMKESPVAA